MITRVGQNGRVLRYVMESVKNVLTVLSLPGVRTLHPWMSYKKNQGAILPINVELQQESIPLSTRVAAEFIDRSAYRIKLNICGCRRAYDCQNHSHEIGCLFLGESTLDFSPAHGHMVSKAEALEHLHKSVAQGLVPQVGKVRVDNFFFDTPDIGKLMSICFCCHCCCMGSFYKDLPVDYINKMSPLLKGLAVKVTDECTGCGACMEYCMFDAISIEQGKAVHSDICRLCGRCASRCPQKAVEVSLDNPNAADEIVERISSYADVT